ncbi:MAG: hypothetical protein IPM63_13990 [Acidobacteriota bacterium]|nr:MAG: hypothetical protein IPM63_13990 [Acidobacteriota bacterium]
MFTLEQPSMALNSVEISWSKILMWNTWEVDRAQTREHIVEWVATVAGGAPGGKLKNVVINCHGLPGWVGIGQGFNATHLGLFRQWRGLVFKIWFVACRVAETPTASVQAQLNSQYSGFGTSDGHAFCSNLAQNANSHVYASTEVQRNRGGYSLGQMPTFEGLCYSYSPNGRITWSHRYSSDWQDNQE